MNTDNTANIALSCGQHTQTHNLGESQKNSSFSQYLVPDASRSYAPCSGTEKIRLGQAMLNKRIALLFTIRSPLSGRQPISLVQQHFGGKFGSLMLPKEILKLEQFYHSELIYIETPGKLRTRHGYSTLCHSVTQRPHCKRHLWWCTQAA